MQRAHLTMLANAAQQLESTNLATTISHTVGMPIEKAMSELPGHWASIVSKITRTALEKAMDTALYSLDKKPTTPKNTILKLLASTSGAIGGTFGITALAIELPISATIMLRSIVDVARSYDEDLDDLDCKMACLTVFALSGGDSSKKNETADTSYYAVRSFLTKAIGGASVNWLFIEYYQKMAKAHFSIRFLERKYGAKKVEQLYKKLIKYN